MFHIENPDAMTPDERLQDIAAILARGLLRLREKAKKLAPHSLELSTPSRLTVTPRWRVSKVTKGEIV